MSAIPPEPAANPPAAALRYPLGEPPAVGELKAVAPGVYWIRLPLPLTLDHINVWALADGEGWTIVDTGMNSPPAIEAWDRLLSGPLAGRPVTRVIGTHMHPDHVGLSGWLTQRFDCRLWITRQEYLMCRTLVADTGKPAPLDALRFYRRAGWDDIAIQQYQERFGQYGRLIHSLPDSFRRIQDGERFNIGDHVWQVVVGLGHSPEHACLYCPELKLLISGDQVLPRISSNVSVHPTEPDANPLDGWIQSLRSIRDRVPADVLVLPAHNEPFEGLHDRLNRLEQSQLRILDRLRQTLSKPCRVIDVFGSLFARQVTRDDGVHYGLATGESIAHLNYLLARGELRIECDPHGVQWYGRSAG